MNATINSSYTATLLASLQMPIPARIAVIGPTGCGKTTLVRNAAIAAGYDISEINSSATSLKQIEDELRDTNMNATIESFFSSTKKLLFIDDIDVLMMSFPKLSSVLDSWLATKSRYPIVLCSQSNEERRLSDIKKYLTVIRIAKPTLAACLAHFIEVTADQNVDEVQLLNLIKAHKYDLRAIMVNLHQVTGCKKGVSTGDTIKMPNNVQIDSLRATFSDLTLFDIQNKIFATPLIDEHMDELVYTDSKLLGLLLYENVPYELQHNRITKGISTQSMLTQLVRLSDVYILCDKLETYTNANMYYDLAPILNNVMLGTVNQIVHKWPRTSTPTNSFLFTPMMTKTALRYQFAKRKTAFLRSYGLSSSHFIDATVRMATYLGAKQPRERDLNGEMVRLSKATIDAAAKWGVDYEVITSVRANAWKKYARAQAKLVGEAQDDSSDER